MAVAPAELASIPLFASLSEAEREQVAGWFEPRTAAEGCTLAGEGATGYCFFVLAEGQAAVSPNGSQLATLGPGDFFGEMALFDRSPRSATIQADSDTVLLVLDRAALAKMTEVSPRAAAAFFESLVLIFIERLRASGDLVAEVTRWGLEATGLDVESR